MIGLQPRSLAAAIVFGLACCVGAAAPQHDGWLSVKDFGASGSKFETAASATAGSKEIVVKDVGDFKVGQGVMVSRCNVRYTQKKLFGPHNSHAWRPLDDEVEVRGYDGTAGNWVIYVLDVDPAHPTVFRWSDDLGRTWQPALPITYDWQRLGGGTEVRFGKFKWQDGYTVTVAGRDQLETTIESVKGDVLTLKDPANRTVAGAIVRHNDTAALQGAVDRAIREKKNVFLPIGSYRLSGPIVVSGAAAIAIEGQSAVETVLDISEGEGACLDLKGNTEVTIRNLAMVGHTGFDERDKAGLVKTRGTPYLWGFFLKPCAAMRMETTERLLVENCHARRMSQECFYSAPPRQRSAQVPKIDPKAITYLRCSVEDCARNAFNNNFQGRDTAENTNILYCRILDVGGCSWEGASRFVRFIGNYVRNAGTVAMGNIRSRDKSFEEGLGSAQHIIADNVFEGKCAYGDSMIRASAGANQVIIRNNLFVNFNSSAVHIKGDTGSRDLPASNALVVGNIFDMTAIGEEPKKRTAVTVTASDVMVGDNQIYVRGACDPLLTGIQLRDAAVNLNVYGNLIRNCGTAVAAGRVQGRIGKVLDSATFLRRDDGLWAGGPPLPSRRSHGYRGWNVMWLKKGGKPDGTSVIDSFDAESCQFRLREPRAMKAGDAFEIFPPSANWNIHNNTITGCQKPVVLDCYGSETSLLKGNLITRGDTAGVSSAVEVRGMFKLIGNQISGFDEKDSSALSLCADPLGRTAGSSFRDNIIEKCTAVVPKDQAALWAAAEPEGNVIVECGGDKAPNSAPSP